MTKNTSDNINKIINCVCNYYGVEHRELNENKRLRRLVLPRQMIWSISKELLGNKATLEDLGSMIASRKHCTVLIAIKSVTDQRQVDKEFDRVYTDLLEQCRSIISIRNREDKQKPITERLNEVLRYKEANNIKIALREIINTI